MAEPPIPPLPEGTAIAVPQLWRALERLGWSQGDLARAIGTSSNGVVNRWLHGHCKPSRKFAGKVEKATGVAADAWDEPMKTGTEA